MDSTTPIPEPDLKTPFLSSSSSSSATKLPIKRKAPSAPLLTPSTIDSDAISIPPTTAAADINRPKPPPFKFHRVWTEADEICLLQSLIDSTSTDDGLSFPRDLSTFYDKFSNSVSSQPYSKSQLSEKLRRLRKKFRVISSRISRGQNPALLSPHDRALFDLSKKLWSSNDNISKANFDSKNSNVSVEYAERINLFGVKVNFSPVLPTFNDFRPLDLNAFDDDEDGDHDLVEEEKRGLLAAKNLTKEVVAKSVLNVFDECLEEVGMVVEKERVRCSNRKDFERRWREQRVAEMDVFARRLRLVFEQNSVNRPSVL